MNPESDNKKFDIINAKLDKILKLLTPAAPKTEKVKAAPVEEVLAELVADPA